MVGSLKIGSNKMILDKTDEALVKSAAELIKKDIPEDSKGLLAAYKEALDLRKQLEDKHQPYQEKLNKFLEILPLLKQFFDLVDLEMREGLTSEGASQKAELWSNFTPADKERAKQIDELCRTKGELTGTLIILDEYCLKLIRLKALDKDIELDVQFEVHDKENYTSFTFDGKRYDVGSPQGQAIKLLHKAGGAGRPDVPIPDIRRVMGLPQRSVLRDSFRRTGLWRTLIVINKKKTCRLSIFP